MATTTKTSVSRSATISVADTTVDDIVAAATKVGAPTTARVTTGNAGYSAPVEGETSLPYSVTFAWTETLTS